MQVLNEGNEDRMSEEKPNVPVARLGGRRGGRVTEMLKRLCQTEPKRRAVVLCADAASAAAIERHPLAERARAIGVDFLVTTADKFGETVTRNFDPDDRLRIVVDETLDMPKTMTFVTPSFPGSFMAAWRPGKAVRLRGPYAREEDAPDLPCWRRNDPGVLSCRS
jgi:hypothetical protein